MNKKQMIILAVAAALSVALVIGLLIAVGLRDRNAGTESTPAATTAPVETSEYIPGVAENPFDDEPSVDVTRDPSGGIPATPEATEPEETKKPGGSTGAEDPADPDAETTQPTDPDAETTQPTDPDAEPEQPTDPSQETTQPTEPAIPAPDAQAFEDYLAMSGPEQEAFAESFGSVRAFLQWYNEAKEAYLKLHPDIEIGDGEIDFGG